MPSMETKDAETRAQPNPLRSCYAFTLVDVVSDLHLRLATVAGGFSILKDREDENDDADHFVSECRHHWGLTDGKEGKLEACGVCHHRLKFVNICTICKTEICNRCLNNRL
ncbi:uncharacterized protein EKO05_0003208 [Ascochyta rabiei]|uniref:uncharacterized protein n=1 Tax=Didymella rabiei TaxID=5454 RepID=UPI002205984A|nr:uncharacterized protein EKO05_0003208 [Ascochyta rabiei]UPX12667.1 hypothetical protein EKO05_0003208 [Ascochyta rabiei]